MSPIRSSRQAQVATATQNNTSTASADQNYQSQYVSLDGQRRHDLAADGLALEQHLAANTESTAASISQDQLSFDNTMAADYDASGTSGVAVTVAGLTENYDIAYSRDNSDALSMLAAQNSSATWASYAMQAALAALNQYTTSDAPGDQSQYATALSNAASQNTTNLASDQADESTWLADIQSSDSTAISTAQTTVATSNVGGTAASVTPPATLTAPVDPELNSEAVTADGALPAPTIAGQDFVAETATAGSFRLDAGGITMSITGNSFGSVGDAGPYVPEVDSTQYASGALWSDQDFAGGASSVDGGPTDLLGDYVGSPVWQFPSPYTAMAPSGDIYPPASYGATLYGIQYAWTPNSWSNAFSASGGPITYLPALSATVEQPPLLAAPPSPTSINPAAPADPTTTAITQQQAAVVSWQSLVSLGGDALTALKDLTPPSFKAATALVTVAAAAGFAETDAGGAQTAFQRPSADQFEGALVVVTLGQEPDNGLVTPQQVAAAEEIVAAGIAAGVSDNNVGDLAKSWVKYDAYHTDTWDGNEILQIIQTAEGQNGPMIAAFVARQFTLENSSSLAPSWIGSWLGYGAYEPTSPVLTITNRLGQPVNSVNDIGSPADAHYAKININIPKGYTSQQVAEYIISQIGADASVNYVAQCELGTQDPTIYSQLQDAAFAQAAQQAAAVAKAYYKMLLSFVPGAGAPLAVYDLQQGAPLDAAMDLLFSPEGALATSAVAKAAGVKILIGGQFIAAIPMSVIKRMEALAPNIRKALMAILHGVEGEEAQIKATEEFLANPELRGGGQTIVPSPAELNALEAATEGFAGGKWVNESTAGWSESAIKYQEQITGNPAGRAFEVNGVKFDGVVNGALVDAKGPSYARLLSYRLGEARLLKEAARQVAAAKGVPIVWHVAEKDAASAIATLFASDADLKVIDIVYTPPLK